MGKEVAANPTEVGSSEDPRGPGRLNPITGYRHSRYARSLAAFGVPRLLPESRGWLLEREIPGSGLRDVMGPYPLFSCSSWAGLEADLRALQAEFVTLCLVPDPFGDYDRSLLERCFDTVRHFKERYVIDLARPACESGTAHHRYYTKKALSSVVVEHCPLPSQFAREWVQLYAVLIERHGLAGIPAFNPRALAEQLEIPGIRMFRALYRGASVGFHLWYVSGDVAYSHLTALDDAGYRLGASYALYSFAIGRLADEVRWIDLGAGAGTSEKADDGLSRFKRGWANSTRSTFFCTRVYDRDRYASLLQAKGHANTAFFPAYRLGEFASETPADVDRWELAR